MALRVVQWATGGVGVAAIKGVLEHPDLELVGCWVHSEAKNGKDVGEIIGVEPLGVTEFSSDGRRWMFRIARSEPGLKTIGISARSMLRSVKVDSTAHFTPGVPRRRSARRVHRIGCISAMFEPHRTKASACSKSS